MNNIIKKVSGMFDYSSIDNVGGYWRFTMYSGKSFARDFTIPSWRHKTVEGVKQEGIITLLIEAISSMKFLKGINSISDENFFEFIKRVDGDEIDKESFFDSLSLWKDSEEYTIFCDDVYLTNVLRRNFNTGEVKYFGAWVQKEPYYREMVDYFKSGIISFRLIRNKMNELFKEGENDESIESSIFPETCEMLDKFEEPKFEEPKFEEPKFEEPKFEEPKFEELKFEEPKFEEPKVEEPKVEEPRFEEPRFEEPKVEEPKISTTLLSSSNEVCHFKFTLKQDVVQSFEELILRGLQVLQLELIDDCNTLKKFNEVGEKIIALNLLLGKIIKLKNGNFEAIKMNSFEKDSLKYVIEKIKIYEHDSNERDKIKRILELINVQTSVSVEMEKKYVEHKKGKTHSFLMKLLMENR